ncbi:unnamed protein product, partial [marine sediment metagenome]
GKVLFVGIGNVLRSDDGIGVYISNNIKPSAYISYTPESVLNRQLTTHGRGTIR